MVDYRDSFLKTATGVFSLILIFLFMAVGSASYGQKKVKLQKADFAKGGRMKGERYERLLGNVVFTQNKTTIYCDSAHFFKKQNSLDAYGQVRVTEGDSVTITGKKLEYDGDEKLAKMRNNVVFTKLNSATLYTDNLDYRRNTNTAYYFNGGKLVDSANVLTSRTGYYNVNNNIATFKKDVKVVNPDYTMYADSLRYNSRTKIIYFITKTKVIRKDSVNSIFESGIYNTVTRVSDLKQGTGESQDYSIKSKSYDLDAVQNVGKARGDVVMTHKKENLLIYGQASDFFKNAGITKVYNNAYMAKITDDNDTLFMRADTLVSIDNPDPKKRKLLAYNNVRIFKKDLQGIADSLEYRSADSMIFFYNKPILWAEGNQLTADSISMLIKNNSINKIFLKVNAFVISTDTLLNFNQIKGRKMTANIAQSKISQVYVEGNGESLYFALDDKNKIMMGMNKIICSNIMIRFKEGRVNNLSFYVRPEADFIPPHELQKDQLTLKGFAWKGDDKPTRDEVVKGISKEKKEQEKKPEIKRSPSKPSTPKSGGTKKKAA
ncbi:OstA-like protein [Chryseosolibacter indicus]|uniref:Organic solvent tolerance protein OstA n=1 Tax=Chryseosolibacter indicus TaxID=2782351 RepID=A0ABS5VQA9_9BACT|nr:OstA-like protein [Chryseosolibacter indicus]MBT1702196.1 Organic solvent tolerance protein OstA [Chryseosolibacter indicus]